MKAFTPKIRNKIKMSVLATSIQHCARVSCLGLNKKKK